jgi:squalene-hopene/tetraprenyl-beta-curcumene cyclase
MGLVRHRRGPRLPITGFMRSLVTRRVLQVLTGLQPEGGGFLEATPLTAFVTMSLIAAGEARHPVVRRALAFLVRSARDDGSWPIDTNLATWVTTLSVNAGASEDVDRARVRDWLLRQQWTVRHPYTGAAPGGWAWTNLSGGVPDADDTAGAVLALRQLDPADAGVREAVSNGIRWLLDLQNRDGGIPTFCRGWGALPFDRSSTDLTAHAMRAWIAWRGELEPALRARIDRGLSRGVAFLESSQRADGAFVPLWFGNQRAPEQENPVYGTSRVLTGLADALAVDRRRVAPMIDRARRWLADAQNGDGSWGGDRGVAGSIEETSVALEALARSTSDDDQRVVVVSRGLAWLESATGNGCQFRASPVGLYFARLWYCEELYPLIFTVGASHAAAVMMRGVVR